MNWYDSDWKWIMCIIFCEEMKEQVGTLEPLGTYDLICHHGLRISLGINEQLLLYVSLSFC